MITRNWTGVVKPERTNDYIAHLHNDEFERLKTLPGFRHATVAQREVTDGTEFLVVTCWDDMASVVHFAGEAPEIPDVPAIAQEMMVRYDPVVRHYEEVKKFENERIPTEVRDKF